VKIVQTGASSANGWSIAELNVYGTPPATLLRDNWTAGASPDDGEAQLGIDGRIETQWSTNTAQGPGMSYQVDMKAAQSFNEITLDVECNPADYPRGLQVFVSSDGASWGTAIASATGMAAIVTVAFPQQSARYLKVVSTASASNYWGLAELNVLNTNPSTCSSPCVALDQCHDVGTCNPSTGVCSNPFKVNGTACNDGSACTQTDTCQAGVCTGGNPVTCTASDQCHTAGTCNSSTGSCSNPAAADGTSCNDGKSCTAGDVCAAGVCAGTVACLASDQCHTAGACDANGACTSPTAADGTTCNDGKSCTTGDVCTAGVCGGAVTCPASDQCHTAGACDANGACTNPAAVDGTSCDDGDLCTRTDACVAGACVGGNPVTCTASDQCHVAGTCDGATGMCSNPAKTDGASCDDGQACTAGDACHSGSCQGIVTCPATDQCHLAGACGASGVCTNPAKTDGSTCDDGNPSTVGDQCVAGVCSGSSASCPPPDQCHGPGTRDTVTGICSYPVKTDGVPCNDGNPATNGDTCRSGTCSGKAPSPCSSDFQECDDGNPCTTDDTCFNGVCSGELTTCSPSTGECASFCNLVTGACSTDAAPDGTACDDGSSCTTGDVCSAGTCAGVGTCTGVVSVSNPAAWSTNVQPSLPLATTADHSVLHAGDAVALTVSVTFDGIKILTTGVVDVVNNSPSDFAAPGYSVSLEYLSPTSNEWVALERFDFDATGQPLPPTTPGTLTFAAPSGGFTVPSGKTQEWDRGSTIFIPQTAIAILNDPAQASAVREAFRIDEAPGLPSGAEVLTSINFPIGATLTVPNLKPVVHFDSSTSTTTPMTPAAATVTLGASQTFTGVGQVPALLTPSQANALAGYLPYLKSLSQKTFVTTAFVFSSGSGFGSGAFSQAPSLPLPMSVPIVAPTIVSGPATLPSGYPATFDATLANPGNEAATDVTVQDLMGTSPFAVVPATIMAPTTLAIGDTEPATIVYQSQAGVDLGTLGSEAQVTWQDGAGNAYGPFPSQSWSTFFSPALPLGTLSLAGQPTHPIPVNAEQDFTVTAIGPSGQPAAGVNVQLTVTGANPQALSALTDASGVAAFSYVGQLPGGDSAVASATITTAPTQSGPATVFWSSPYGTPCAGTDAPLDIMLIVDTSSSMVGPKLDGAKASAQAFLNTLDLSRDQLGVGYFNAAGHLSSQLTSSYAQAKTGIDNVVPGDEFFNPTNIGAGLTTALDELGSPRARPTATPIIIFVTDGGNSYGDPEPAIARLKASGIRTIAFGLGSDADAVLLNRLASSKNDYYYAPRPDELSWIYNALGQNICRNQLPLVHAGGNQGAYGVRLPDALTLQGEVHDSGPPGDPRLTSEWTFVSGPGSVTFGDASSPITTALFSDPGTYVLQLTASDGFYSAFDTATITVDSEPSLSGAALVASLGSPGPLTVGGSETLFATLRDSSGQPITRFPVQVTITGPNAQTATVVTDANGVATVQYTGGGVGTDVLTAAALGTAPVQAAPVSVAWQAPVEEQVVTQGWIGAPLHQSSVTGQVGITVSPGVTLTSGIVTYWPFSAPDQVHTLATGVSGGPGAVIATLDATVLANGPWVVKLDGTDDQGHSQVSEASVTVSGDYKPGRVVVEETDMTIPLVGIPLTVGRRYDSLEKDNVGDFGNGWSLMLGQPRLEVDPAHNVTITMPDNRRVTFYFQATSATSSVTFAWLYSPGFVPEAGTFGTLTSDGCDLMVLAAGQLVCFLDSGLEFAPTTYKYTDQYGRVFTMAASGELKSIVDRQQNTLTFTPNGISSSSGVNVTFQRDPQGRITQITSPPVDALNNHQVFAYAYDPAGNLATVTLTDGATENFTYSPEHLLLTSQDPNGNPARTSTYDTAGHLLTDTDALHNVTSYAYDLDAHTTTITNPDTGVVTQTFDDRGLLLKEVDPLGRTTEHTYDTNRTELTRKNALGEVTTMTYDANGNQKSIKNDRGETTLITYNELSQPLTSTDPANHTTTISYDDMGIPTKFSDELGTLATFMSSEHGLPLTVTDAVGNTTYLVYDAAGDLTARTDRLGRTTTNVYDGVGRLTQKTDPRGTGTSYSYLLRGPKSGMTDLAGVFGQRSFGYQYDENLNLTAETSDLGRFTNYTYDALNHLTKVEHADHTTIEYTRDFRGNALTMKDESQRTTTYVYDKAGQLKKTSFPDGTFTTREYDGLGRLVTATDERAHPTTYEYEPGCGCADRVTKVTDPLGRSTVTTYDPVGRRASVTDAAGHKTSYAYDVRGHLTTTTYVDNTAEVDAYDSLGRRTSHTDQMSTATQYGYDAEGQLTSVTDMLTHVTQYGYDASGNLASVTDANGHTTSYVYDHLNRKSQRTLPLGMSESWTYNMYGDGLTHVDFRGKTTTMTYDGLARMLTKVPDPTLGEPTVTFTYNPTGTRASMADASGTTTYGYEARDRLLTKATPAGTLTYTYDAAGNVASIRSSNANGTSVDYVWDAANQLISVTDNRAGGVTTSAYTATGRPSTLAQPSGVGATYGYDVRDRATSLAWQKGTNSAFASWSYEFNGRGQRTSVTDVTGRHVAYGYDAVSRLVDETITHDPRLAVGDGELSYSLDSAGNRLSRTSTLAALGAQTFTYDANDQLSTNAYDANGNTTGSDGHTYAYDFENRLRSKDSGAVIVVYDGDGNRAAKTVAGVTTKYLVDDLNPTGYLQVLEEIQGAAIQTKYTYGAMLISQVRQPGPSAQTSYYGYDGRGNVSFLTDANGIVTDTYDYDAWGNLIAAIGTTANSRFYDSEELDPDLGLLNLRARYYNANRGRFLSLDPVLGTTTRPQTFNRYVFAGADPENNRDPTGRDILSYFGITRADLAIANTVSWGILGMKGGLWLGLSKAGFKLGAFGDCATAAGAIGAMIDLANLETEFFYGGIVALGLDQACEIAVIFYDWDHPDRPL
jgi:RHS repeat-associated protein